MTARATARHRAALPASTPLTGLTSTITTSIGTAVGDHATVLGRGGVALAVSTGLVAGVALPASAATRAGDPAQTASVPLLPEAAASPVLSADAAALSAAPVTAPAQAKVTFEHSAFKALPHHGAGTATPAGVSRAVASISRSLARQALSAAQPSVQQRVATVGPGLGSSSGQAPAPVPAPAPRSAPAPAPVSSKSSVVAIAMRYLGVPYRYGGASPRGFDCSGLTQYVFAQVGISLARSADGQYRSVTRIARSQAVAGDLVFYLGSGGAYHVGIYLGGNTMIAAPHTGEVVRVQEIYSSNVAFGRP